jgi:hypothetical protein
MAKELGFEEIRWQCGAIDDAERLVLSGAEVVYGFSDNPFARAGFALKEDGRVTARRVFEYVEHGAHSNRTANDSSKLGSGGEANRMSLAP